MVVQLHTGWQTEQLNYNLERLVMQKLSDTYRRIADLFGVLASIFLFMSIGAGISVTFTSFFSTLLPISLLVLAIVHILLSIIFHHKYKKEKFLEDHVINLPSILKDRDKYF